MGKKSLTNYGTKIVPKIKRAKVISYLKDGLRRRVILSDRDELHKMMQKQIYIF